MKIKANILKYKDPSTNTYTSIPVIAAGEDISTKQDKTDNSLNTTSKSIVGAINELSQDIVDLKNNVNIGEIEFATEADIDAICSSYNGDINGYVDANNNIILSGLAAGTYTIRYENTDGTYANITTYTVGNVVQYSITENLTNCVAASSNPTIINDGSTVTLKYLVTDGLVLSENITVSGASYNWNASTGTLVLSNPTSDVTITIVASKSGVTNLADPTAAGWVHNSRISSTSSSAKPEGSCVGAEVTNYIPSQQDSVFYIKGLDIVNNLPDGSTVIHMRCSDTSEDALINLIYSSSIEGKVTITGDVTAIKTSYLAGTGEYIRFTGTLLPGYTAEDVIITLNEPIIDESDQPAGGYTNIIDTIGYTDGYRLSTSTGELSQLDGFTTTGYINFVGYDLPITLRTKGVNFNVTNANVAIYNLSTGEKISALALNNATIMGTGWNGLQTSFDNEGNLTLLVNTTNAQNNYKIRICGQGSGANLIVTINEEIVGGDSSSYTNLANPNDGSWLDNTRFSTSTAGGTSSHAGMVVVNYIPYNGQITLRAKGLDFKNAIGGISPVFVRYADNKGTNPTINWCFNNATYDETTHISTCDISGTVLNGEYFRFSANLVDGYTANDVIITLDEEITD